MTFNWKEIFKNAGWAALFALIAALIFVAFLSWRIIIVSIIAAVFSVLKDVIVAKVKCRQLAIPEMDDEGDA